MNPHDEARHFLYLGVERYFYIKRNRWVLLGSEFSIPNVNIILCISIIIIIINLNIILNDDISGVNQGRTLYKLLMIIDHLNRISELFHIYVCVL